jgi:hypothetical protein
MARAINPVSPKSFKVFIEKQSNMEGARMQIQVVLSGFFGGFPAFSLRKSSYCVSIASGMRTLFALIVLCVCSLPISAGAAEKGLIVNNVRYASYAAFTRVVFEVEAAAPYVLLRAQRHGEFL